MQAFIEAEMKLMNSNKYAVEMKELDQEMKIEHEILVDGMLEIEDKAFQEWEHIT